MSFTVNPVTASLKVIVIGIRSESTVDGLDVDKVTVGGVVSTIIADVADNESGSPGSGSVVSARFPAVSRISPDKSVRAEVPAYDRSSVLSPSSTV